MMENKYFNLKPLVPKNKRGMGIGDIYPVVLAIALVAILIAIVMFILTDLSEQMPKEEADYVVNESLSIWAGTTNQSLAGTSACGFEKISNTTGGIAGGGILVYNVTNDYVILAPNYTVYSDGRIINISSDMSNHTWQVSYGYTWGGASCDATIAIVDDFADFVPWIGIILLVVAAAIVLGILVRSFSGGDRV